MDDLSTPIEYLKNNSELPAAIDTRGNVDQSAQLNYNDLLKNTDDNHQPVEQDNVHQDIQHTSPIVHQQPQQNIQFQQNQNTQQQDYMDQRMYSQRPSQQPMIQSQIPNYPQHPKQYQQSPKKESLFETIQKDFIVVLICSIFVNSSIMQSMFKRYLHFMFDSSNSMNTIGVLINSIFVAILVIVLNNINLSVNM